MTELPIADVRGKTCAHCKEPFENGEVICGEDGGEFWWHERCVPSFGYSKLVSDDVATHCEDCGVALAPNDIHAGLKLCFNCDPPWVGTEG